MAITSRDIKKAGRLGVSLADTKQGVSAIHMPSGLHLTCPSAADAIKQMEAVIAIAAYGNTKILTAGEREIEVLNKDTNLLLARGPHTPFAAFKLLESDIADWIDPNDGKDATPPVEKVETPRDERGVALDGAIAYSEGTPAGDNPHIPPEGEEETDEIHAAAVAWDDAWDAAADATESAKPTHTGSVVSDRYRAKYAEAGHPTTCGDWLATTINNLCLNKGGTNLEIFEIICTMNGVDLSKYNRTSKGWQGRFRMTGRNLLAKKVYAAEGVLKTPDREFKATAEWMAEQKYKQAAV